MQGRWSCHHPHPWMPVLDGMGTSLFSSLIHLLGGLCRCWGETGVVFDVGNPGQLQYCCSLTVPNHRAQLHFLVLWTQTLPFFILLQKSMG